MRIVNFILLIDGHEVVVNITSYKKMLCILMVRNDDFNFALSKKRILGAAYSYSIGKRCRSNSYSLNNT